MGVGWLKREGAKGGGGGGEDEEDEVEKEREAREKEREASKRCENARRQDRQGGGGLDGTPCSCNIDIQALGLALS